MSDQFVAEIRIFPFNFAPRGWALCNGQIMPISQNTALFSLVGTFYGGNGTSNFALPDLQGRTPVQGGQGAGLSPYDLGQIGGEETVTLLLSEIPLHSHTAKCVTDDGGFVQPVNRNWGLTDEILVYSQGGAANAVMSTSSLTPAGGNQPHNNMPPYLALNFCIALQGIFPARN